MFDQCNVQFLLFGCLVCLIVIHDVNADGRVFLLDLRNSSAVQGFKDAEQACALQNARLASAEELHHAVVECFFSQCTRGWLYGGTVGTTLCDVAGSSLKAVAVRTENATVDMAQLSAFCIKDRGLPCGDPPSFPNSLLQEHSGFEMGDELVYTCVSGYVMPSGHTAFSLLCDSCGEWYGAVQICVKDKPESHIDYEDKFTDSYKEADHDRESQEESQDDLSEETNDGKKSMEQERKTLSVKSQEKHQEQYEDLDMKKKLTVNTRTFEGTVEEGEKNKGPAFDDSTSRESWEEDKTGLVDIAPATEEPVSVLSQKHMFWFPPEAFPEEEPPVSTDFVTQNPSIQITQRSSGGQSEESKEHESQETPHHPVSIDIDDHDHDDHEQDNADEDEQDNSRQDDHDDLDSHQEEDRNDDVKHPAQHGNVDGHDHSKDHDDHYDMGEHEDDRDRVLYGSQEYDDKDETHEEHGSDEDHDNPTDNHNDHDREYPDASDEHPDHDDHNDNDDDRDHDTDHKHKDDDNHDSHEDDDDLHVIVFGTTNGHQNFTPGVPGRKASKDESWLDGYPVALEDGDNNKSSTDQTGLVVGKSGVKSTDRPNEVEIRGSALSTPLPGSSGSPTKAPKLNHKTVEIKPSFVDTPANVQTSETPSYSDTLDYDTQQEGPTHSWMDDLTEHPFLDHGPAPPVQNGDIFNGVIGEHTVHNLPGEEGERGEPEGEMKETICVGEDCPPYPPNQSSQGPKVAAIIVAVCAVATAVIIGVWCYRRQQQKSSMYEMNGKGHSQNRQGQQIEMQQKV